VACGLVTSSANAQRAGLVISQIYGAGGNTGASYNTDFVELFNGTGSSISLTGYTLQYASATGTFNNSLTLTGTIASGRFFLISLATGATGAALPVAADQSSTNTINLAAAAGKVALANSTTVVTFAGAAGSNTFSSNVVDFVGYGTTANAFEGTAAAPAPSTTTAIVRALFGTPVGTPASNFVDSNNNGSNFIVTASGTGGFAPRNSQTPNPFGASFVPSSTVAVPEANTFALIAPVLGVLGVVVARRRKLA
jgi:hypothetical protein